MKNNVKPNKEDIIFETIVGSRLYGTDNSESDTDYKGVAIIPQDKYYFGFSYKFEQYQNPDIDREIYEIRKFCNLLSKNNPNIIDLLFAPEQFWIQKSPVWDILYENRFKFITKKCRWTFSGYAYDQLKRIKNP
jgi:predicted nucleotidyltransferase